MRAFSRVAIELGKERFLGPDSSENEIARSGIQDELGSVVSLSENGHGIFATIGRCFGLLWKEMPAILFMKSTLAVIGSITPLMTGFLTGKLLGSITSTTTHSSEWSVGVALGILASYILAEAGIGRLQSVLYDKDWRQRGRVIERICHNTISTWSFEDLEDSAKRIGYKNFRDFVGQSIFGLSDQVLAAVTALVTAVGSAVLLWGLAWQISVGVLGYVALRICRDYRESKHSPELQRKLQPLFQKVAILGQLSADPAYVRDYRIMNVDTELQERYQQRTGSIHSILAKNERRIQITRMVMDFVPVVVIAAAVSAIFAAFKNGQIIGSGVATYVNYALGLRLACNTVGANFGAILSSVGFANLCLEFTRTKRTPSTQQTSLEFSQRPPRIELRSVTVVRGERKLLDVPSLDIQPGEVIGIRGKEGAGKSTLIKVLLGVRELSSGQVNVSWDRSGQPTATSFALADCNIDTWHRMIGVYNQDFEPPKGVSVKEVLDMAGKRDPNGSLLTEAEVMNLTTVSDFVDCNRGELDTVIGAGYIKGRDFSGGQKKLIALCLALRPQPAVLILDEPTAHVSSDTGKKVLAGICELARKRGQTVIIVSHNESNFEFVDRTLTVADGRIVADEEKG